MSSKKIIDASGDLGFQDLLSNGAIACILLFLIIGINTAGKSVLDNSLSKNRGINSSEFSIPIKTNRIIGMMKTVYMVEIDLNSQNFRSFNHILRHSGNPFEWEGSDDIVSTIQILKKKIIFSAVIGSRGNIVSFGTRQDIDVEGQIRLKIIEGRAETDDEYWRDFGGLVNTSFSAGMSLSKLEVEFISTDDRGKLFKINSQYLKSI